MPKITSPLSEQSHRQLRDLYELGVQISLNAQDLSLVSRPIWIDVGPVSIFTPVRVG